MRVRALADGDGEQGERERGGKLYDCAEPVYRVWAYTVRAADAQSLACDEREWEWADGYDDVPEYRESILITPVCRCCCAMLTQMARRSRRY